MAYLCETEDVCLYGRYVQVVVLVKEEDCGDVDARWGRGSHEVLVAWWWS